MLPAIARIALAIKTHIAAGHLFPNPKDLTSKSISNTNGFVLQAFTAIASRFIRSTFLAIDKFANGVRKSESYIIWAGFVK